MTDDTRDFEPAGAGALTFAVVAALAGAFLAAFGFRGIDLEGLEFLNRARETAHALTGQGTSSAPGFHPGADLLSAVALLVTPLSNLRALHIFTLVCFAMSTGFVALTGWRLAGRGAGVVAALLFLGNAVVVGAATTITAAAPVVLAWTALLAIAASGRWSIPRTVGACVLAGLLLLSWAPVAIWLLVWVGWEAYSRRNVEPAPVGTTGQLEIPLGLLLVPVGALLAATLMHPALLVDPLGGWKNFALGVLTHDPGPTVFGGETYRASRPPLWAGAVWSSIRLSPTLVLLAIPGLAFSVLPSFKARRFDRFLAITLIFLLWLPWLQRGFGFGDVPFLLLAAPVAALVAGRFASTLASWFGKRGRNAVLAVVFVGIAWAFAGPIVSHPKQGRYFNVFAGYTKGAAATGHDVPHEVVSLKSAREAAAQDKKICGGRWNPVLYEYRRSELAPDLRITQDCLAADVLIR